MEDIFKSAVIHHNKKNFYKAREIYESLLKNNPSNFIVLQNYATLLAQIKEFEKADYTFKKCLKIKPKDPLLLYNYGKFLHEQKNYEKAIKFYKESFDNESKSDIPLYNIGNIYLSKNEYKKAITYFEKVIKINPSNFLAYNNMAISYKNIGNFNEALKFYKAAINKNNNYVDGHVNYSTMLLTMNNMEEGLEEYEWRKKSKSFSDYIDYRSLKLTSKVWNGETLENKKLFVIAEQGIGDLIQFARYLYLIKSKYKTEITLKLKGKNFLHFFNKSDLKVISDSESIPPHDYHIHMMSLLRIFFRTNELFCSQVNFLPSDQKTEEKWNTILSKIRGFKIGIHWSTSAFIPEKHIPLEHFIKLANNFDSNFFVLQKDVGLSEKNKIKNKKNIFYFPEMDNSKKAFLDSIEIIKNLDLVITSDTAIAHLSATLGRKTWIALPFIADWRWFDEKKNSKWYKNFSIFRQKKAGDWSEVFQNIAKKLKEEFRK